VLEDLLLSSFNAALSSFNAALSSFNAVLIAAATHDPRAAPALERLTTAA
jgi:hypothetical protein